MTNRCQQQSKPGYGQFYPAIELARKAVSATIIQELGESCEIDWYLQAQLAYNKRIWQ